MMEKGTEAVACLVLALPVSIMNLALPNEVKCVLEACCRR